MRLGPDPVRAPGGERTSNDKTPEPIRKAFDAVAGIGAVVFSPEGLEIGAVLTPSGEPTAPAESRRPRIKSGARGSVRESLRASTISPFAKPPRVRGQLHPQGPAALTAISSR